MLGEVDLAHSTGSEQSLDHVAGEDLTAVQRHVRKPTGSALGTSCATDQHSKVFVCVFCCEAPYSSTVNAIDPDKLDMCLQVLADIESLPPEHPDAVAVRRATASIFKSVKKARRDAKRDAVAAADHAVTAATATGAPGRIDDETAGLPLLSTAVGATAGTLLRSRACYMCKERYTVVDAFYHQLCPECAALNRAKRDARTDLTGRSALLTGGRAKIGMYIALRLLRDGARTTITTRFPLRSSRSRTPSPRRARWTS